MISRLSGLLLACGLVGWTGLCAAPGDASVAAGRPYAPMTVRWKPERQVSPLPPWAPAPVEVLEGAAVFHLPARWKHPAADRYVLTVVFEDTEDGGPTVEWRSPGGVVTRLSDGLGESGQALGLHARTLVLPDAMTRDGGAVAVAMPWRIEGLVSISLRPARDASVAVTGTRFQPGLGERSGLAVESEELEGREVPPLTGDVREGSIVEAELAAGIEILDGELDFRVPADGGIEGAMVWCDVLGLDPAGRIDVLVNGLPAGELQSAGFRLDDPAVTPAMDGRLAFAGWRKHSLYLPASLFRQGENSILLRRRAASDPSARTLQPVALKNTYLHLRFGGAGPQPAPVPPPWPVDLSGSDAPDFPSPIGLVEDLPPLPLVLTSPPKTTPQPSATPRVLTT
ncbi:MAG: hypothetical protein N2322_00585, partial [Terrimicrobiaceae bacterium]|nr:hypothetical protein [Terrimicrobiaceae bacterium]